MQKRIDSWDDLRFVLALSRHRTLTAAANELGVNQSTVFRRINSFEDRIGARLFDRQARGYRPTPTGEEATKIAVRVEDDILALDRRIRGAEEELAGVVRLTTVDDILRLIGPHLHRFHRQYPAIVLEVNTEPRLLSLTRREADVALRPGGASRELDLISRPLVDIKFALYAAPAYIAEHGRPRRPASLADHSLIGFDQADAPLSTNRWIDEQVAGGHIGYRSNSVTGQIEGARAGLGIALLPCFAGDAHPGLERLFRVATGWNHKLWLLIHGDLRQTARVRAFVDFIAEVLVGERARFEGRKAGGRATAKTQPGKSRR